MSKPRSRPMKKTRSNARRSKRLHDAGTPAELDVAWAASLAGYQQRGAPLSLRVEATYHDLGESFSQEGA